MKRVLLAEAIRPGGNRDEAGSIGESMHQLADFVAVHLPEATIEIPADASQTDRRIWEQIANGVACIRDSNNPELQTAINRVCELARN